MPLQNGKYVAPTWVNGSAPAIDASELQAMSDSIERNQGSGGVDTYGATPNNNILFTKQLATTESTIVRDMAVSADGVFCGVVDGSTVYYSNDGGNWTALSLSPAVVSGNLYAVTYGNGMFVAVGNGVMYSARPDSGWTAGSMPSGETTLNGICYFDGKWVAGGSAGIYTSTNLTSWTNVSGTRSNDLDATASTIYSINGSGMMSSTDGVTWTAFSGGMPGSVISVDGNGNILTVAKDDDNGAWFYNGSTWTQCQHILGNYESWSAGAIVNGTPYFVCQNMTTGFENDGLTVYIGLTGTKTANVYGASITTVGSALAYDGRLYVSGSMGSIASAYSSAVLVDANGHAIAMSGIVADGILHIGENIQIAGLGAGELPSKADPAHGIALSWDNSLATYVDGTAPAMLIDNVLFPLMKTTQFNYVTTANLNNIRRGVYWINGYSSSISGDRPFTNTHYMLISAGNQNFCFQMAVNNGSTHTIKTRYLASGTWSAWV